MMAAIAAVTLTCHGRNPALNHIFSISSSYEQAPSIHGLKCNLGGGGVHPYAQGTLVCDDDSQGLIQSSHLCAPPVVSHTHLQSTFNKDNAFNLRYPIFAGMHALSEAMYAC